MIPKRTRKAWKALPAPGFGDVLPDDRDTAVIFVMARAGAALLNAFTEADRARLRDGQPISASITFEGTETGERFRFAFAVEASE